MLAPNHWDPASRTLHTVVSLSDGDATAISLCVQGSSLIIRGASGASARSTRLICDSVARMLRLNEDLAAFHERCLQSETHLLAAKAGFGRLLRGATLFEDMVKVICTCNVTWRQTVSMVDRLVERWGVPAKVSRRAETEGPGGPRSFPTPARLAQAGAEELRSIARLGYRAEFVQRLARDVVDGDLDLTRFEQFSGSTPELHRELRRIHGIGAYAASNLCMLLGRYDCLAIDTEMVRFLKQRYPRRRFTPASMKRHYETWAPFQFLAYWWELWQGYESQHGPATDWQFDAGRRITQPAPTAPDRSPRTPRRTR